MKSYQVTMELYMGLAFEIKPNTILVRPGILGTWYYTLCVYLADCTNMDVTNKRAF